MTDKEKAIKLLEENVWHFAKTLSHMPHYYTRRKEWKKSEDFTWICDYIDKNAVEETFKLTGNYVYKYLYLGDFKYWVMERDKKSNEQILINRADPKLVY